MHVIDLKVETMVFSPLSPFFMYAFLLQYSFLGLEIQFLVAATGSRTNPQNKIISSVATVTTGDWVMK